MDSKNEICSIEGCNLPAKRSISSKNIAGTTLRARTSSSRVNLCKDHYRQFKKETKADRDIERARSKNL